MFWQPQNEWLLTPFYCSWLNYKKSCFGELFKNASLFFLLLPTCYTGRNFFLSTGRSEWLSCFPCQTTFLQIIMIDNGKVGQDLVFLAEWMISLMKNGYQEDSNWECRKASFNSSFIIWRDSASFWERLNSKETGIIKKFP